jgi:hypothetical protein
MATRWLHIGIRAHHLSSAFICWYENAVHPAHKIPFVVMRINASCRLWVLFVSRSANPSIQAVTIFTNTTASSVTMVARREPPFDNLAVHDVSRPRASDGLMHGSRGSHRWEGVLKTQISMRSHQF